MKFIVLAAVLCRLGAAAPINTNIPVDVAADPARVAGDAVKGATNLDLQHGHINGGLRPVDAVLSGNKRHVDSNVPVELDAHNIHVPVGSSDVAPGANVDSKVTVGDKVNAEVPVSASNNRRHDLEETVGNVDVDSTLEKAKGVASKLEGVASSAGVPDTSAVTRDIEVEADPSVKHEEVGVPVEVEVAKGDS